MDNDVIFLSTVPVTFGILFCCCWWIYDGSSKKHGGLWLSLRRSSKVTPYSVYVGFGTLVTAHLYFLLRGALLHGKEDRRRKLLRSVEADLCEILSIRGATTSHSSTTTENTEYHHKVMITHSCRTLFYLVVQALLDEAETQRGDRRIRIATCSVHFGSFHRLLRSLEPDAHVEYYEIDLREKDWTLDKASLNEQELRKCDLVLCQNLFGVPFCQDILFELGHKHGIPVLEDCVQCGSLYGAYKGHRLADVVVWSAGLDKTPACLGGGLGHFRPTKLGAHLYTLCQERHEGFAVDAVRDRSVAVFKQALHLMVARNTAGVNNLLGCLAYALLPRTPSGTVPWHALALVVRQDKTFAPFQHATAKFCRRPCPAQLLALRHGMMVTRQHCLYGNVSQKLCRSLRVLIESVPEQHHASLFPWLTPSVLRAHQINGGIPEFMWVASPSPADRDKLGVFLSANHVVSLINTTWVQNNDNDNDKSVGRSICKRLVCLPNPAHMPDEAAVRHVGAVLTKWCREECCGNTAEAAPPRRPPEKEAEYTLEEVEAHRTLKDFWTVIDNAVYDLSGYGEEHPGGRIILNAAGADATVLFHQYHIWSPQSARCILEKYRIGVLKSTEAHSSPNMGDFWREASVRVIAHLKKKNRERRPLRAKLLWFFDVGLLALMMLTAVYFLLNHNKLMPPFWLLAILHFLIVDFALLRVTGQSHANGHEQIWDPRGETSWWAELVVYLFLLGIHSFSLPYANQNGRTLLNKPRRAAQYEFTAGRGFSEHNTLHHVKGADLEDDPCRSQASAYGIMRLDPSARYLSWLHPYQSHFLFQTALNVGLGMAYSTRFVQVMNGMHYAFLHLLPAGEHYRGLAILIGAAVAPLPSMYCHLALLFSGPSGFWLFVVLAVLRQLMGMYPLQVFWAGHVWDASVPEDVANRDWGRHNAATTYSWWGATSGDIYWQPSLWGTNNGSCPSTLTYHLEHSLFPGLNYLHLPEIAPIVCETCGEFGVPYHALYSTNDLMRTRNEKLRTYGCGKGGIKML